MNRQNNQKYKGFTLIELLVVIAIISLLVSILLPSLKKAKDLALTAVCASNMKQVGLCFHLYADENNECLPEGYHHPTHSDDSYWRKVISVYAPVSGDDSFWDMSHPVAPGRYVPGGVFNCPSFDISQASVLQDVNYINFYNNALNWLEITKLDEIHPDNKGPSYTPMYLENNWNQYCFYFTNSANYLDYRHNEGMNHLFVDGHVKYSDYQFQKTVYGDFIGYAQGRASYD